MLEIQAHRHAMQKSFRSTHFSKKHILIARISQLFENITYTQRRGLVKGMKRRGGLGFLPEFLMPEDTLELRFFRDLNLTGKVVFDIGAFQGLTTMWFSTQAEQVVTYEPNPQSHTRVKENLRLNKIENVTLRNVAVGDQQGQIVLTMDPLMPGAASAAEGLSTQMQKDPNSCQTVTVPVVRVDDDIRENDLPEPDFIKIDIEGFELNALKGLTETLHRARPALYLEMHGASKEEKIANVSGIVDFLMDAGYCQIQHIESKQPIDSTNVAQAAHGHLYCQFGSVTHEATPSGGLQSSAAN